MRERSWCRQFLAPVLVFVIAIFLGPFLYMLWLSLTDLNFVDPQHNGNFVALANYARALLTDSTFLASVWRSASFTILAVVPEVVIGLVLAEVLHSRNVLRRLLSPALALPVLLPGVVVGLYWRLLLHGEFGVLGYLMGLIDFPQARAILSTDKTILLVLACIDIWQWAPFMTLIFLAARDALPRAPLEAAWIDGASPLRAFFDVTLRALWPAIFVLTVLRSIDAFKEFDKIFVLTGGGPGTASEVSSIYVWRVAFRYWEFGYGAALCVLVYLVIYTVSTTAVKMAPSARVA